MSAREISLTQNQAAIVDEGDYEYLNQFHWYAHWNANTQSFYAARALYLGLRDTAELAYRELYEPAAQRFPGEYAGGMR